MFPYSEHFLASCICIGPCKRVSPPTFTMHFAYDGEIITYNFDGMGPAELLYVYLYLSMCLYVRLKFNFEHTQREGWNEVKASPVRAMTS